MLVTFTALHEAKRDGTLAQTLAAMTPAERVEAAQVCAANSTRTVSEWLATFGELVEDAGYAVYCEACGVAVDPAVAVLDGELMVCPGCAPCSAAEFEAMQMAEAERLMAAEIIEATYPVLDAALEANDTDAYYSALRAANESLDALVPDPEAWQAVSAAPCEPATPIGAVSSISRAELFDSLCSSVDELRDYWRDVPRRLKAINEAWEFVLMAEAFYFNANGDLLVESSSRPGTYYAVGHSCPCTAGRWGNHCRHSIVADLIGRAVRIARLKAA